MRRADIVPTPPPGLRSSDGSRVTYVPASSSLDEMGDSEKSKFRRTIQRTLLKIKSIGRSGEIHQPRTHPCPPSPRLGVAPSTSRSHRLTAEERATWQVRMYSAKHVHGHHYREKVPPSSVPCPTYVRRLEPWNMTEVEKKRLNARLFRQYIPTGEEKEKRSWQQRMFSARHVHGHKYMADREATHKGENNRSRGGPYPMTNNDPTIWTKECRAAWQDRMYHAPHIHGTWAPTTAPPDP